MKDLSELHELKANTSNDFQRAKLDCRYEEERIEKEIEALRREKEHYVSKMQHQQQEFENKRLKIDQFYEDINK